MPSGRRSTFSVVLGPKPANSTGFSVNLVRNCSSKGMLNLRMPAKKPLPKHGVKARVPVLPVRDNVHFPELLNTLLVGREVSVKALQAAMKSKRLVLVLAQREVQVDEPSASDLYRVGTLSEVMQVLPMPDGTMRVVLRGLARCRADSLNCKNGHLVAEVVELEEVPAQGVKVEALKRETIDVYQKIAALGREVPHEALESLPLIEDAGHLADLLAHHLNLRPDLKQTILEELDSSARLEKLLKMLMSELSILELQSELRTKVDQELGNTQREYYLREQLRLIQKELGREDALSEEGEEYASKIEASGMPTEHAEKALQEVNRLDRAPPSSPESMVIRNYLDWLVGLPWNLLSDDRLDVRDAARVLDRDHFGLAKVKDRILDFLAVRQLSQSLRGPILCFVGPPGVGKTSIGRSIAEALGRKFVRVSLGGVRDEAEIRGHRRTYIGSMPGRLIQGIKTCGTRNPVFMLDEIDKMGADFHGDPTSALLEALDPEQNEHFSDHYIEVPFDLSAVMFIMTANLLENIPNPLRDRMEVIRFPSYTEDEKLHIAKSFLVPKKVGEHGLSNSNVGFQRGTLELVTREYTREAGVRELEREIATLCRKAARRIAEGHSLKVNIDKDAVKAMLGNPRYRYGVRSKKAEVGSATGLVYTEFGGDIVTIEASLMEPFDQPQVRLTGSLGAVMQESAHAAFTYVRTHQADFKVGKPFAYDVHVHVPEGAVPKDGPSAGITMATALVSAYTGRPVRTDVAMTGEITLRGKVLPVGGVREKTLAAHRAGIKHVILPEENLQDLDDLPESARRELKFHPVKEISEAIAIALAPAVSRRA